MNNYIGLDHSSNRYTPTNKLDASHNRFIFSNLTTQNCDHTVNNETVNLDDSALYYAKSTNPTPSNANTNNRDKNKVKIIAQFSKGSNSGSGPNSAAVSRQSTSSDMMPSQHNMALEPNFLDI